MVGVVAESSDGVDTAQLMADIESLSQLDNRGRESLWQLKARKKGNKARLKKTEELLIGRHTLPSLSKTERRYVKAGPATAELS
jgi:hypothetical protein